MFAADQPFVDWQWILDHLEEIREATVEHLRLTVIAVVVGFVMASVLAIVAPHERTTAAGITGLVRMAGWAISPLIAGVGMEQLNFGAPLIVGALLKIGYDLLLWRAFRHVRPPEERAPA